jgi:hypothetical protein
MPITFPLLENDIPANQWRQSFFSVVVIYKRVAAPERTGHYPVIILFLSATFIWLGHTSQAGTLAGPELVKQSKKVGERVVTTRIGIIGLLGRIGPIKNSAGMTAMGLTRE